MSLKIKGIVTWFREDKGYGFLHTEDRKDIFVHYSSITGEGFKTLKEDDGVLFELREGTKGLQAYEVEKIK